MKKRAAIIAGVYLLIAVSMIAYELNIRLAHRGNSEFAGMLSFGLTLPSSIAIASLSIRIAGIRVGDSDTAFVVILALAAVVNAALIFAGVRRLNRS
jgi:ABC-type glycerol-3-phosphate transport system permease component